MQHIRNNSNHFAQLNDKNEVCWFTAWLGAFSYWIYALPLALYYLCNLAEQTIANSDVQSILIEFASIIVWNISDKTYIKHFSFHWHCLIITKIMQWNAFGSCANVNSNVMNSILNSTERANKVILRMFTVCLTLSPLFNIDIAVYWNTIRWAQIL